MAAHRITHRQRVEACLSQGESDRSPVALWRHFPVDDQSSGGLASAVIEFQKHYDFDLVKVTPASSFCIKDWGVEDGWRGATEGTREYTRRVIRSEEDWRRLKVLDPGKGKLAEQLTCLEFICNELEPHTPVLQTVFSPLAQAKNLVGADNLIVHLRQYPDALHEGLQIIAQSTQRFIEAALKTGISGIFYAVQQASYGLLSKGEYLEFGCRYDLDTLKAAEGLWCNMLHLHGSHVMFDLFMDYPMAILNWHDRDTYPSLKQALGLYRGVLCGGLRREQTMVLGTPEQVTAEAREAILMTSGKRLILGTGCVLPIHAPRANILAARHSVE